MDVLALVQEQGFVTTRAARRLGVSANRLAAMVSSGVLVQGVRSVYLAPGSRSPEARHALLTRGILSERPSWVASHHSALSLFGLPLSDVAFDQIHVAGPLRNSEQSASVFRHVLDAGDEVLERHGHATLAPALACLQVAARFGVRAGVVSADACLRAGLATPEELRARAGSGRFHHGVEAARRTAALADGRAESPMESLLRLTLAGLPFAVVPQANVGGPGEGYRADLLVDGRVVVEYDGRGKYEGPDGHRRLLAEKSREDFIRSSGYGFTRVTSEQLAHPATVRVVVARAVSEARAVGAARQLRH